MNKKIIIISFILFFLIGISIVVIYAGGWSTSLNDGLNGVYGFDEGVGTNANNTIGGHNNFTLLNGITWTNEGKFGNGLGLLDGIDDYISTTNISAYNFTNTSRFSLCFGWNMTSEGEQHVVSKVGGDGTNANSGFEVVYFSSKLYMEFVSTQVLSESILTPAGNWMLICLTSDGTQRTSGIKIYVNGTDYTMEQDNPLPDFSSNGNLTFGGGNPVWSYHADGTLDHLYIWETDNLSASEIADFYNGGDWRIYSPDSYPSVILDSPINRTNISSLVIFNCTSSDDNIIQNLTLFINGQRNISKTNGITSSSNITAIVDVQEGNWNWTCESYDNAGKKTISGNRTFIIDKTPIDINITSPINNSEFIIQNTINQSWGVEINISIGNSLSGLSSMWYSNDSFSVNKSLGDSGYFFNLTNISWGIGEHHVRVYVNDSAGNINMTSVNFEVLEAYKYSWNSSIDYGIFAYYNFSDKFEQINNYDLFELGNFPFYTTENAKPNFYEAGNISDIDSGFRTNGDEDIFDFGYSGQNLTINFWLYLIRTNPGSDGIAGQGYIITKGWNEALGTGWDIVWGSPSVNLSFRGFGTEDLFITDTAFVGQNYTMLTITKNNSHACLWVNSNLTQCKQNRTILSNSNEVYFGMDIDGDEEKLFQIDELAFWNTAKNFEEIRALYNYSEGMSRDGYASISVDLNQPANNSWSSSNTYFNATITSLNNLANASLYGDWNGGHHRNKTITFSPGTTTSNASFVLSVTPDGVYNWTIGACDVNNYCVMENKNYTINIDTISPTSLEVSSPLNLTSQTNLTIYINASATDDKNVSYCGYNITKGGAVEKIETQLNCSNFTDFHTMSGTGTYVVRFTARDNSGNENITSRQIEITIPGIPGGSTGGGGGGGGDEDEEKNITEIQLICKPFDDAFNKVLLDFQNKNFIEVLKESWKVIFDFIICKASASVQPLDSELLLREI